VPENYEQGRLTHGYNFITCGVCDEKVMLLDTTEQLLLEDATVILNTQDAVESDAHESLIDENMPTLKMIDEVIELKKTENNDSKDIGATELEIEVKPIVKEMNESASIEREHQKLITSASGQMQTDGFLDWAGSKYINLAIVFTDIVGSTKLGDILGDDGMSEVRKAHFAKTRELIRKYKGKEVKNIGDGFLLAFKSPIEALDFILELSRNTGHKDIRISAGIHSGIVNVDDNDVFGTTVNFTSRICGIKNGDNYISYICVSERAYNDIIQVKTTSHSNLKWVDYRNQKIKGLEGRTFTIWSLDESLL
jgi:class 3 adenylate cyclase